MNSAEEVRRWVRLENSRRGTRTRLREETKALWGGGRWSRPGKEECERRGSSGRWRMCGSWGEKSEMEGSQWGGGGAGNGRTGEGIGRWSWGRGRSGGLPEKGEEDDQNGENQGGSWRGWAAGEEDDRWVEELEMKMVARRSGGGGGLRRWRLEDGGIAMGGEEPMAGARSGGGRRSSGGDGGWTPSPAFLEQPLESESTPFFLQMTARVCGGGSLPLL